MWNKAVIIIDVHENDWFNDLSRNKQINNIHNLLKRTPDDVYKILIGYEWNPIAKKLIDICANPYIFNKESWSIFDDKDINNFLLDKDIKKAFIWWFNTTCCVKESVKWGLERDMKIITSPIMNRSNGFDYEWSDILNAYIYYFTHTKVCLTQSQIIKELSK